MKRIFRITCMSAFCCARVFGQTNCPPPTLGMFVLPPARLRAPPADPQSPVPTVAAVQPAAPARLGSEKMTLSTGGDDLDLELYHRLEQEGCFARTPPGNAVERCFASVFQPEVVHLGKTSFSCTVITAIKRKNPLCLLNPMFLNLSW